MSYLERLDRWLSRNLLGFENSSKATRFYLAWLLAGFFSVALGIINLIFAIFYISFFLWAEVTGK